MPLPIEKKVGAVFRVTGRAEKFSEKMPISWVCSRGLQLTRHVAPIPADSDKNISSAMNDRLRVDSCWQLQHNGLE